MVVCRVADVMAAIPIEHVAETMRPLPITAFQGMGDPFLGIAIIRGRPVPVLSGRKLLGMPLGAEPTRFVVLQAGHRTAALAVDAVVGIRAVEAVTADHWPELARSLAADTASAIGLLDQRVLLSVQAARIVPEAAWQQLAAAVQAGSP
jgi:purine-binding chemotaxis protein CheW